MSAALGHRPVHTARRLACSLLLVSLVIGTFWGAVFGFVAHWSTHGQRDFSSVMTLQAQRPGAAVPRVLQN